MLEYSARFEEIEKTGEEIKKMLHKQIDEVFTDLNISGSLKSSLKTLETNFDEMILDLTRTVNKNRDIIKTAKFSELSDFL